MGEYQLDVVLSAVADPTRRAILDRLLDGDARVTDLAREFPISLNSTSKHIKVLERAELVRREVRGREHVLSLHAESLGRAVAWMDRYRAFWDDRLAALEAFVLADAVIPELPELPELPEHPDGRHDAAVGDAPDDDEPADGGGSR
ncbi:ArsR/SmtB family transcription factor [Agromyces aureus]|uniref:ArsR/SmtB family transcription factor n=1 Tax=Agromyces aureus TaxID=453304 RepID=UPI00082D151C|nr:metalloregulator ArsR/SmtB family transcription factor [Agromyces aureus]